LGKLAEGEEPGSNLLRVCLSSPMGLERKRLPKEATEAIECGGLEAPPSVQVFPLRILHCIKAAWVRNRNANVWAG
jgi:hypothetical protein